MIYSFFLLVLSNQDRVFRRLQVYTQSMKLLGSDSAQCTILYPLLTFSSVEYDMWGHTHLITILVAGLNGLISPPILALWACKFSCRPHGHLNRIVFSHSKLQRLQLAKLAWKDRPLAVACAVASSHLNWKIITGVSMWPFNIIFSLWKSLKKITGNLLPHSCKTVCMRHDGICMWHFQLNKSHCSVSPMQCARCWLCQEKSAVVHEQTITRTTQELSEMDVSYWSCFAAFDHQLLFYGS